MATNLTVQNFVGVWRAGHKFANNYSKQIFRVIFMGKRFNGTFDGFWHPYSIIYNATAKAHTPEVVDLARCDDVTGHQVYCASCCVQRSECGNDTRRPHPI